jgi:hypothetical protein
MAKFYVQCGEEKLVLAAKTGEAAAAALIGRILAPHLWIYAHPHFGPEECRQHLMLEALLTLPTEIRWSERGFDRLDARRLGVPETISGLHRRALAAKQILPASTRRSGGARKSHRPRARVLHRRS